MNIVRFMRPDGSVYETPPGKPVIQLTLPRTCTLEAGSYHMDWEGEGWRVIWALVDTGADKNFIDLEFAKRAGLSPTGSVSVSGVTATAAMPIFEKEVYMNGANQVITGEFVGTPLIENGQLYPFIIGMDIISQSHLNLNFFDSVYSFDTLPRKPPEPKEQKVDLPAM